jgi:ankyrin repeat protein
MWNRSESNRVVESGLIMLVLLLAGCGKSPEDARKELGELGIEYNVQSFFETVVNNDPLAVELFLISGIERDAKIGTGVAALHLSTAAGNMRITGLLLEHGADVGIQNSEYNTPLHLAITNGNIGMASLLLDHGASVNQSNVSTLTPLDIAFQHDDTTSVEVLLKNSSVSVRDGLDVVYRMWEHEKERKRKYIELSGHNSVAWQLPPLLISAADADDMTAMKLLLDFGVNPNSDSDGTALHHAMTVDACKLLVDNGADPDYFAVPLVGAIQEGRTEVVRWLMDNGADVNRRTIDGRYTPLISAVSSARLEVLQLLLSKGADTNGTDIDGETPLMKAVASSDRWYENKDTSVYKFDWARYKRGTQLVEILIDNGALVNVRDKKGETTLMKALEANGGAVIEIIKMLIDNGADVNALDNDRKTPLIKAIDRSGETADIEVIKLLVKRGANVNASYILKLPVYGNTTRSVLDRAEFRASYGDEDNKKRLTQIVRWLKAAGARSASRR